MNICAKCGASKASGACPKCGYDLGRIRENRCPEARCQLRYGHKGPHGADVGKGEYAEWVSS